MSELSHEEWTILSEKEVIALLKKRIKALEGVLEKYEECLNTISELGARENVFPRELGEIADKALD
jgi:hypothetical protein